MAAIARRRKRIEELEAENASLRARLAELEKPAPVRKAVPPAKSTKN